MRYPLNFEPGCNNPAEVVRDQLIQNVHAVNVPWLDIVPAHRRTLAIVGGGPSVKWEIGRLISLAEDTDILALNGAYGFLRAQGIEPTMFMLLDTRIDNISFLRDICESTRHYIAAQCHPDIFKRLTGYDVTMYLTTLPGVADLVRNLERPKHLLSGSAGTVGIKALSLAYVLGYRKLELYGYDSSHEARDHHAYPQPLNDDQRTIEVFLNDKAYLTTPSMAHQAQEFIQMAKDMAQFHKMEIGLYGDGLLYDMVRISNDRGMTPLETREREKYLKLWADDRYRKSAPGENHVDEARKYFIGQRVIDFGCGTGRAAQRLQDLGHTVIGIDHASNCRDPGMTFTFMESCLWNIIDGIHADWGFSTDVLEHIPREHVIDVLRVISRSCRDGAYLNIATRPDVMGGLVGEKLHLTVMNASQWCEILRNHWAIVEVIHETDLDATIIVRHHNG